MRIYRPYTEQERRSAFMSKFRKEPSGCWRWIGAKFKQGYGVSVCRGRKLKAHRVSHELFIGPIPAGLLVLHKCDHKWCVNPDHLECGTQAKNVRDAVDRGLIRARAGEEHHGAKLTELDISEIRSAPRFPLRGWRIALAARYGVSKATINDIRSGRTWNKANPGEARRRGWLVSTKGFVK